MFRNRIKLKFPAKAKTALYLVTATGFAFYAAANRLDDSSAAFPDKARALLHAVARSSRALSTIAVTAADYKYSLRGLPEDSDEYGRRLSEVHLRSSKRIRELCEANRGFYVKAGQFVAAMRQVPKEYSSTLSSLQDQAVPCHFKAVKQVLIDNLGQNFSEKVMRAPLGSGGYSSSLSYNIVCSFLSLDEQPIAAASIAQVHRAMLADHQAVAVKIQYPGLGQQMKIDTTTMSFLSKFVSLIFPDYRFGWLVSEFTKAIFAELDFIQEAKNCERAAKNFNSNKMVKVPQVFWELTTSKVLTMQFCEGCKVDDIGFLKEKGIQPKKVAKLMLEVFAEMIFVHGFVHGDPHPGNLLVCPEGSGGFSLVLLDHGIYKELDEGFRRDYCQLWKAMILLDSQKILQLGEKFGVGKYSRYFPLIFTGRTINSKSTIGAEMPDEEKRNLKHELKSLKMEDISSFMESLPPDFLTLLRTDGLLRSILSKLGASRQDRLLVYAKYALVGLQRKSAPESDATITVKFGQLKTAWSYLQLQILLDILELLSWMEKMKQVLTNFYGWITNSMKLA